LVVAPVRRHRARVPRRARRALPGVAPDAIERGFRYARELLDDVLLRRCNKSSPALQTRRRACARTTSTA
jgi:hypothetical protein